MVTIQRCPRVRAKVSVPLLMYTILFDSGQLHSHSKTLYRRNDPIKGTLRKCNTYVARYVAFIVAADAIRTRVRRGLPVRAGLGPPPAQFGLPGCSQGSD